MVNNPVVFLIYKREVVAKKVFEVIRKAQPQKLYLFSDGAKNSSDRLLVEKTRESILNMIDWKCDLFTYFLDDNLGVYRVWNYICEVVFKREEAMIYLQEDLLPSNTFFRYCDELLDYYKYDDSIYIIGGMNYIDSYLSDSNQSYFFLNSVSTLGFAIWKRTYLEFIKDAKIVLDSYSMSILKHRMKLNGNDHWINYIQDIYKKPEKFKETGEEFFLLGINANLLYNKIAIAPNKNMIKHIGFIENSENMDEIKMYPKKMRYLDLLELNEIDFPLIHPKYKIVDLKYYEIVNKSLNPNSIYEYVFLKLERIVRILVYGGPKLFLKKVARRLK